MKWVPKFVSLKEIRKGVVRDFFKLLLIITVVNLPNHSIWVPFWKIPLLVAVTTVIISAPRFIITMLQRYGVVGIKQNNSKTSTDHL